MAKLRGALVYRCKVKFDSLNARLTATLLLLVIVPSIGIGWLALGMMKASIVSEQRSDVGRIAAARHAQLATALAQARGRAEHLLSELQVHCVSSAVLNRVCMSRMLGLYLAEEGAMGASLQGGRASLSLGAPAPLEETPLLPGQIAQFLREGAESDHAYFILAEDKASGFRLSLRYPSAQLDRIFGSPPSAFGQSGETFLADGLGYFATKPRFQAAQGHSHPVAEGPMQACLSGQNGEALAPDYRFEAAIHGYRFIPELGRACIMAHLSQSEAFAPLRSLEYKLILAVLLICGMVSLSVAYLVRSLLRPITRLTEVTRAIAAGDYRSHAEPSVSREISELASSFNLMTHRLVQSEKRLSEAQQLAHIGSWERDLMTNSLSCSDEIFRILEIDLIPDDFPYEKFIVSVHPEDRESVDRAYMTGIQTKEAFTIEHRMLLDNGRVKWVNEHGIFHFDTNGVPLHSIGTIQDISERKRAEENASYLAYYDQLTGLPNRRLFLDHLEHALAAGARSRKYGAVMSVYLNNFKILNDTMGHQSGDGLLVEVSNRLQGCVREVDTVARLGGNQYAVLMEDMHEQQEPAAAHAREMGERILATIKQPWQLGEHEIRSTASIGIRLYLDHSASADTVLKNAGVAMSRAKAAGRNTLQFFEQDMQAALEARAGLEIDLHRALSEHQFKLYYQPQLELCSGELTGVEALVRWQHPERGLVSPLDFIPIAEETGLIVPLGDWVMEEACRQLAQWQDCGIRHIRMSVNLAAAQFADPGLPARIQELVALYGIPPGSLDFEVTESMTMKSPVDAVKMMERLTSHGHSLSIDDFGTGYSSLAYLKLFPVSTLKIDRSFVKDIETDSNDASICDITVLLAHKLGMAVVAEGVETQAQLTYLLSIGCEKIQGYLISKPLPADQALQFIRDNSHWASSGTIDLWPASLRS